MTTIHDVCYCACYGTKYKHLHIPTEGEFLIRNGEVHRVIETDSVDSGSDEIAAWDVYTEVRVDDE